MKQIIKDMMPTCFNVLVYQMDSAQKANKAAETSLLGTSSYAEDEQEFDASTIGVTVVVDPVSSSVTQIDVKANQASEFTDFSSTSDNATTAENISDKNRCSQCPITIANGVKCRNRTQKELSV